jgi:putative membrane protein
VAVDATLAIIHHLAAFALTGALVSELVLLRGTLDGGAIRRFGAIDALYGASAGIVVVAGIGRLLFGAVPIDFYLGNAFFWIKMSSLATVAAISILPTISGIRWRRALAADASYGPPPAEIGRVRRALAVQLAVLPLIPISAALMARGIGAL